MRKIRLNVGRNALTFIRNPHVRTGWQVKSLKNGHGTAGIRCVGVFTWRRRTKHVGAHKLGVEVVR